MIKRFAEWLYFKTRVVKDEACIDNQDYDNEDVPRETLKHFARQAFIDTHAEEIGQAKKNGMIYANRRHRDNSGAIFLAAVSETLQTLGLNKE